MLTCTLGQSSAQQAGNMMCGFKASGSSAEEKYVGRVAGLSQPVVGKQVLVWSM